VIEIHCPACGAEGRTTKEKINTRLVCRKCFVAFHVTPSGRALLGEPPLMGDVETRRAGMAQPDRTHEVDQWFERLSGALFSPLTAMLLVGLIVLVIGSTMYSRGETLEDRVKKVARAAYEGDTRGLESLAAAGTGEDVVKWNDAIQLQLDQLRKSLGNMPPSINVEIQRQDTSKGIAEAVARMSTEQDLARQWSSLPDPALTIASGVKVVELPLRFRTETWKGWRLDGKQTLEALPGKP